MAANAAARSVAGSRQASTACSSIGTAKMTRPQWARAAALRESPRHCPSRQDAASHPWASCSGGHAQAATRKTRKLRWPSFAPRIRRRQMDLRNREPRDEGDADLVHHCRFDADSQRQQQQLRRDRTHRDAKSVCEWKASATMGWTSSARQNAASAGDVCSSTIHAYSAMMRMRTSTWWWLHDACCHCRVPPRSRSFGRRPTACPAASQRATTKANPAERRMGCGGLRATWTRERDDGCCC